jgi:hypothetical protein
MSLCCSFSHLVLAARMGLVFERVHANAAMAGCRRVQAIDGGCRKIEENGRSASAQWEDEETTPWC